MHRHVAVVPFVFFTFFTLIGCDDGETGYVQLRVAPPNAVTTPLYLAGGRLDFTRSQTVILQLKTGLSDLKMIDSAWAPPICKISVRKDRISVLTVMPAQNPPKCVCEIRAPESEGDTVVCG